MSSVLAGWGSGANVGNEYAAGVLNAYIKKITATADDAAYSLGVIRDGTFRMTIPSKEDSRLRPYGLGAIIEASFTGMQASATEIALLDNMLTEQLLAVRLDLTGGMYFGSVSTAYLGLRWKLICDNAMQDARRIEYMLKGALKKAAAGEIDAVLVGSAPALGSADAGDVFYALGQSEAPSRIVPDGVTLVEFQVQGEDTWVDMGDFNNLKYSFECLGEDGGGSRLYLRTHAIKFSLDFDCLESDDTKVNLFDTIINNPISVRLTHMDGAVCTITGASVNLIPSFNAVGNVDKVRTIGVHVGGAITQPFTDFGSLWS